MSQREEPTQPESLPAAVKSQIATAHAKNLSNDSKAESGSYLSAQGSLVSLAGISSALGPAKPPLAWSSVRHQIKSSSLPDRPEILVNKEDIEPRQCQHAVLMTCLHLAHEMNMRDVGQYAWYQPQTKDPKGSMMKVMKSYAKMLQDMDSQNLLSIRSAPDPSKHIIQHHLLRSRQMTGPDNYIIAIYNGHGIQEPPTEAGELWCYDKSFEECALDGSGPTEYIPMMLFELLSWAGASTCYVWDCNHAGRLIQAAKQEADEIDNQLKAAAKQNPEIATIHPPVYAKRHIHFAACASNQQAAKVPGLPDDLFTACLVTPLRIALLYHNLQTFPLSAMDDSRQRSASYMDTLWENMSQALKDRLWSELQAILHTIAWQALESSTYQRLFGLHGLSMSTLSSGFLLAQRVLGAYNTTPQSLPPIPSCIPNTLWLTWDLILENLFEQLPDYFDADGGNQWESNIQMISFMQDQLQSILTSNQGMNKATAKNDNETLSRLPIVCQAATTELHREQATRALDGLIMHLTLVGLGHAVHCGVLDVALKLLEANNPAISNNIISIWATLIKHEGALEQLADSAKKAEHLSEVKAITVILQALEHAIEEQNYTVIVESAAIICAIVSKLNQREAPMFLARAMKMAARMLEQEDALLNQWAGLLVAELLNGLTGNTEGLDQVKERVKAQLIRLTKDSNVETRASSLHALSWWIKVEPVKDISHIKHQLGLAKTFLPLSITDAAVPVRRELCKLFEITILAGGRWSILAYILLAASEVSKTNPAVGVQIANVVLQVKQAAQLGPKEMPSIFTLMETVKVLSIYIEDPDAQVQDMAKSVISSMCTYSVASKTFDLPSLDRRWTAWNLSNLTATGSYLAQNWANISTTCNLDMQESNHELFRDNAISMRAYLEKQGNADVLPLQHELHDSKKDHTWITRHRLLEDSLVVGEQQAGLPWKWQMKDIESPDPWLNVTCHSFTSSVLSCNNSQDMLLWDWSTSKKTGTIHIDLPKNSVIKAGRFVNELHDTNVIMAEISTGDIHIFAGPTNKLNEMRPVSSFMALDINDNTMDIYHEQDKRLVCSWWRHSGWLGVGGASQHINIWDCPAEQRVRQLHTRDSAPVSTLVTEPKSGNLILAGLANGTVKLFDTRQAKTHAILEYAGDVGMRGHLNKVQGIQKLGVVLGESRHITSACRNGVMNLHDIRNVSQAASSQVVQPLGIASASFQAHTGLMTTISNTKPGTNSIVAKFGLYRSAQGSLTPVTEEDISFGKHDAAYAPYTSIHPLRPFLGLGYGRTCFLRGSGIGKGDDTDSGSHSFLRAQAKYVQ